MGRIRVGISSWSDEGLAEAGSFYPEDVKSAAERLRYYASKFDVSEIDSTFHAFPSSQSMELWLGNTPKNFAFHLKAFRLFSGHPTPLNSLPRTVRQECSKFLPEGEGNLYINRLPEEIVAEMWRTFETRAIRPVSASGKLAAVHFQFPPWFVPRKDNFDYLANCRKRLQRYPMSVEFRVGSWFNDEHQAETLEFLRQNALSLVCVDDPQGLKSSVPPVAEVTAPLAVIRFHGRNGDTWEQKDASAAKFNYLYSERELKEWLPKIKTMAAAADETHVILKNKYRDYSLKNALQMKELLGIK